MTFPAPKLTPKQQAFLPTKGRGTSKYIRNIHTNDVYRVVYWTPSGAIVRGVHLWERLYVWYKSPGRAWRKAAIRRMVTAAIAAARRKRYLTLRKKNAD